MNDNGKIFQIDAKEPFHVKKKKKTTVSLETEKENQVQEKQAIPSQQKEGKHGKKKSAKAVLHCL